MNLLTSDDGKFKFERFAELGANKKKMLSNLPRGFINNSLRTESD